MADRVGQQLDNYRLIRLLGTGGFGEVYLAEHIYRKTEVAIKVLPQLAQDDLQGFLTEARTIRLKHPNIVQVLDFGVAGRTPFIVMEYAPNGTLRQCHPRGSRVPLATIVSYVGQVASALQYAHDERLIHRDVKPENMLIGEQHEILLSDFGIATIAHGSSSQSTQTMAGTIPYMAPEQIQAHPCPASDQYALGVVVYEWLSGERPFQGTLTEVAVKHAMVPPPSLREKVPTLSPTMEQVVLMALAKDPRQRFASVQAFASAFEQVSRARQPGPVTPAPLTTMLSQSQRPTLLASSPQDSWQQTRPVDLLPQAYGMTPLPSRVEQTVPIMTSPNQGEDQASSFVTPRKSEPAQRGISRRTVVLGLGLAGLAVAGGGLAWFGASHGMVSPGATPTTPPQSTLTASVTTTNLPATATATGNIILSDPLSQNIHNWIVSTQGPRLYVFQSGAYHITNNDSKQIASAILPDISNQILDHPFGYTLTMQEIKGNDTSASNSFGMLVRFSQHDTQGRTITTFYSFEILNTQSGEYQFWRFNNGQGANVTPWKKLWARSFSHEFHPGHTANTFKIFVNGSNFTFTVNSQEVGTTQDSSITSGEVGMLVNLKGTEVAFSNLELTYN